MACTTSMHYFTGIQAHSQTGSSYKMCLPVTLQWRHNGRDSVSNHQHHDCLLNRWFRRRSKRTSKLRVTGLCAGPVNSPHKWPVTRTMFPFDDVIMDEMVFPHGCLTLAYMTAWPFIYRLFQMQVEDLKIPPVITGLYSACYCSACY